MNSEISMSVSSLTRGKDNKAVFVLFTDAGKSAEFSLPANKIVNNKGFSAEELKELTEYVKNEQDYIMSIAQKVDPMKGFLGTKQGE